MDWLIFITGILLGMFVMNAFWAYTLGRDRKKLEEDLEALRVEEL